MAALTKEDLRDYVLSAVRTTGEGYILCDLKHNLTTRHFAEIQLHVNTDIEDVKFKLYSHTGTKPEFMELRVNGVVLEDGRNLFDYGVQSHDVIEIIDHDPNSVAANGGLDDVSQVERYVMSDADYEKRPNTYRKFKEEQLAKDPNWLPPWAKKERDARAAQLAENPLETIEEVTSKIKVGDRCECFPGARRGEVKYVGYVGNGPRAYADGYIEPAQVWVGVQFDEPVGKNDGSAKGKVYFSCGKNYGAFLKPVSVQVGDFPEKDPFASDDEEEQACCDGQHNHTHETEDVMEEL